MNYFYARVPCSILFADFTGVINTSVINTQDLQILIRLPNNTVQTPPQVLEQLYQSAVSSDATCVICGYNCVDSNGSILSTYSVHSVQQYSGVESLRRHYYHASGEENFVTVWGKLFCKKLFSDLRFRTGICFEDIHLMPYWLLQSEKVVLIPYAGYNYTQNENSIMHKTDEAHSTRLYKNAFVIWQEHLELYKQRGLEDFENAVYCSIVNKVIAHSLAESIPN